MATIKFILRSKNESAQIYIRFSIDRENVYTRKTGFVIDSKKWSKSKGLPIDKVAETKELKSVLQNLNNSIVNKYNFDISQGVDIDSNWLKNAIDLFNGRVEVDSIDYLSVYMERYLKNLRYSTNSTTGSLLKVSTIKKRTTIVNKLEAFQKHINKKIKIKDFDLLLFNDFKAYLSDVERLSSNTIGKYIKEVKTILLDARKHGVQTNTQLEFFKGYTGKTYKTILSFSELEQIKKTLILDERLIIARDWLLIGCFIGQRVGDMFNLTKKNIVKINGYDFIVLTQEKTEKQVTIPIHDEVKAILNKRNGDFPPLYTPNLESTKALFNKYLKKLCFVSGLTQLEEGALYDEKTKRYLVGEYEKYKLVSSHLCRRSFSSNFYAQKKYPTPLLMNVTGHQTERMFLEYIGKKPVDYSLQLAEIFKEESIKKASENNDLTNVV